MKTSNLHDNSGVPATLSGSPLVHGTASIPNAAAHCPICDSLAPAIKVGFKEVSKEGYYAAFMHRDAVVSSSNYPHSEWTLRGSRTLLAYSVDYRSSVECKECNYDITKYYLPIL